MKFARGVNLPIAVKQHNEANASIPDSPPDPASVTTRVPPQIKNATAFNVASGEAIALGVRQDAFCHFFAPFSAGQYEVQLRLDWSDMDSENNPTLDADFIIPGTTRFDKGMNADPAHHTNRKFDVSAQRYLYDFEYKEVRLRLVVQLTVGREITGVANIA